jgi:hypothetical protein
MYKKTVVFDFDGVINSYKSGWKGVSVIPDPPVEGIKEQIAELRKTHRVVIQSTRCTKPEGIAAIKDYLAKYGIEVDDVTADKPPAIAYVDDRAIAFDGNTEGLAEKIRNFHNWIEQNT